jgi:hypothetical protein
LDDAARAMIQPLRTQCRLETVRNCRIAELRN